MAQHFRVDDLPLSDQEYLDLLGFAQHRSTTIDQLHIRLRKAGHKISRTACANWLKHIRSVYGQEAEQLRRQITNQIAVMDKDQLVQLLVLATTHPACTTPQTKPA